MVRWRGVGQDGGLQGAQWKVEEIFREFWAGAPERLSADGSGHILEPEHRDWEASLSVLYGVSSFLHLPRLRHGLHHWQRDLTRLGRLRSARVL
jgi:hypothetical protein